MVTRLRRPPKSTQKIIPVKPPKDHFFFAGRAFERVAWWKQPNLRLLYFYIVVLILTNTANGFDGWVMNGLRSLSYWQDYFGEPRGAMLGFFNSAMSLGSLIGLSVTPYSIDWRGRKMGIVTGSVIMLIAVALQRGAQNIGMFIAARLVLGFGDTIMLNSAPLLIAEIAHLQDRAVLVTLSGASYHSGAFIASWVTYGTLQIKSDWSWRLPSLLQSICSIIILVGIFFMPESPRWLCNKDWHHEALGNDEFVQLEYAEVKAAIDFDKQAGQTGWADFFKTKGNQDAQTRLGINGRIKIIALCENLIFAFLIDKLGLRPIYLISTIGTFVCFNIFTIISARYDVTPQVGLGRGFIAIIFLNYTTEILPYGLRAKGLVWMSTCVTAALFFKKFVNGLVLDALVWKYYIFYWVFLAFEIVVIYFFIVETRYKIAKFFDGDDAIDVGAVTIADMKERGMEVHDSGKKDMTSVTRMEEVRK
ncbi:MFS general substrate transporter [Setomelanomma holmii]|uniref:MFS general substrate transporter n=1 Tax=Setomelanomma holmii TaxID=210430 RepID=A0A9P4LPV6_9PLEO|nr:MFS general substrate transporter [Setomelanomma holmii]